MAVQAGLRFINFEIVKVLFDKKDDVVENDEYEVGIQHQIQTNDENKNLFRTVFIININSKNNSFSLQIQALGIFEILGKVSSNVRDNYLNISAPSIVYPYVRAYVSNITLQSGIKPITIPPMNFAVGSNDKESEKKSKK